MSLSGEENLSKKLFGNGVLGFMGYHIQLWIMCIDILETKNNITKNEHSKRNTLNLWNYMGIIM